MLRATTQLRRRIRRRQFLELPAVYDPLAARIAESLRFKSLYNGGFVTGGMRTISEPLLTMTEDYYRIERATVERKRSRRRAR
jgi:2-methylisocitrate lyase-like PEP mutase family enzyme